MFRQVSAKFTRRVSSTTPYLSSYSNFAINCLISNAFYPILFSLSLHYRVVLLSDHGLNGLINFHIAQLPTASSTEAPITKVRQFSSGRVR